MKNVFEKFLTIIRTPVKVAVALSLLLPAINSFSQFEIDDPRVLNQFIVMLKPDSKVENFMEQFPALHINRCLSKHMNIFLVERNSIAQAEEFLQTIKTNRLVKLAQFNHRIKQRSLIPNDSNFSSQWNMLNTGQGNGVPGADIDATDAWSINNDNVTAQGDTVVIAIIDATFDLAHPDINYFTNYNEIPGNSIDDDGNGYIDDVQGWNVYDTSGNVNGTGSVANHSTHLAGIAGGIGNNGVGIAGVCWGAKILPVAGSSESESEVVAAYEYVMTMRRQYDATAGTQGAFVVSTNTSFGVDNGQPDSFPIWCAMYDSMGALGILSAGATANMGINVDTQHDIPTECPSNYLLAITNTNRNDGRNTNAAYGSVSIDLGAPGTSVFSTFPSGSYQTLSGTSMAAPHVAGAVAAMYAAACKGLIDAYTEKPDSIALLMKEYLMDGAEWITALNNKTVTGGRLNLYRAIKNLSRFNCDSCQFDLSMAKVPISCYGINDGAMAVNIPGDFADYSFQWSNGLQTVECLSMAPGFYDVSVIDSLGCRRYFTDELHYPDSIHITAINIIPALNGNTGNITIVANAGNTVLTYSMDGSTFQSGSTFVITTNGTYTVYVKSESGCVVQRTVVVSGVKELDGLSCTLSVYPNPATDELTVYCPLFAVQKTALEVFDVTGRKIFSTAPTTANWQLTTANWNNGVYFLSIEAEGAKLTKMFVVNK